MLGAPEKDEDQWASSFFSGREEPQPSALGSPVGDLKAAQRRKNYGIYNPLSNNISIFYKIIV